MKSKEWRRIWVLETFNIEIQEVGLNHSAVLQKIDSSQDWFRPRNQVLPSPLI